MNTEDLKKAGYHRHDKPTLKLADVLWQKDIRDEDGGLKYFIDIYQYDYPDFIHFESETRFYRRNNTFIITIMYNPNQKVEDIESIFEEFYQKMNMEPDKHNN